MLSLAHAMGSAGGAAPDGGAGGITSLIPMALMFVIFYFLLIRPQQKRAKEHREMVNNLKKGDRVLTSSGFYGQIVGIDNDVVSIELADKVRVRLSRSYIGEVLNNNTSQSQSSKDLKSKSKS